MSTRRLILRSFQSPGDIVMLTAAVRDLHLANPGQFETDVRTTADDIWLNNPYITKLADGAPGVEPLETHYPLIHESNQRPYHFIHGYPQYLEQTLGVRIPVTRFCGDIHLSSEERQSPPPGAELGIPERFWIVIAGGKYDFTAKWWNPDSFQKVVDHFQGRITFVQCGEAGHWHPPLKNVVNLVGKTSTREFIRLAYHADGILCPITFAMHLAAAVETRPGGPRRRACVVIGGGREPAHWEQYPGHQFLSTVGALPCCAENACWKSRCQTVGDGDAKDHSDVCLDPVQVRTDLRIPRCMELITPQQVIERIELYGRGGAIPLVAAAAKYPHPAQENGLAETERERSTAEPASSPAELSRARATSIARTAPKETVCVSFHHGLGDCAYFAHLIPLYVRRGYEIEVECTPDKRILFEAAGATFRGPAGAETAKGAQTGATGHPGDFRSRLQHNRRELPHGWVYPGGSTHVGHGRYWQGSKIGHNISEPPMPFIGDKTELWDELCAERIDVEPYLPAAALRTAEDWLSSLPRPVILLHTKGNTDQDRKSLPDEISLQLYKSLLDRFAGSIILLDWDNRVPRLTSSRVRHLDELGDCPTEVLLALMCRADLMIGVDSGPLHAARFTNIRTVGVWMPGHYPSTYALPRAEQLNVVLADHTRQWNRHKRIPWNIVEHPGSRYQPGLLAELCLQMLSPPRYLVPTGADSRFVIAADVQLQQCVREWCRGRRGRGLSRFADRDQSFDILLREMTRRFAAPTVIETGTIRVEEDWGGAGFFTYLMGRYLSARNLGLGASITNPDLSNPNAERLPASPGETGPDASLPPVRYAVSSPAKLYSVDLSASCCEFARAWTGSFGNTVSVHEQDSVAFLRDFPGAIDVLYLDSLDTTEPGHAEHAARELEAAWPKLHERSLVLIDDTPRQGGVWIGKGARVVPLLLSRGWQVLYAGYQVLLAREIGGGMAGLPSAARNTRTAQGDATSVEQAPSPGDSRPLLTDAIPDPNPQPEFRDRPSLPLPQSHDPAPQILPTPEPEKTMNVLISFRHGLGDAVQLTIILKHLQKYRPDWNVDVAALVGKHSALAGLCRKVYILEREPPPCCQYAQRFNLDWHECHTAYADSPSTKVERCLREDFGITPDPELCRYTINRSEGSKELARQYLESICKIAPSEDGRIPVVLIHYEGNTSADRKNLPTDVIGRLCEDVLDLGYVPVILDWDRRTPLADGLWIHCPDARAPLWKGTGTGDAEALASLIEMSALLIGVDSGPLHVAGATTTPTIGVWTRHHPINHFAPADNVTHLVPGNHAEYIHGNPQVAATYFNEHYRFEVYDDLEVGLRSAVQARLARGLSGLVYMRNHWVRNDNVEQDLTVVRDIAEEDSYRIDDLPMPRPVVVDVGAHIGCFTKRLHARNPLARIFAVECCPENLPALQKNVGGIATIIPAALTYEREVALLNAVYTNCRSTGGSTVIARAELERRVEAKECAKEPTHGMPGEYWADFRPMQTVTLEDLMREHGFDHIDILKLDCEGSEYSILGKTPSLDRIGLIVGEYHGQQEFEQLVADRFADWELRILRDGHFGTFWLINPAFHGAAAPRDSAPSNGTAQANRVSQYIGAATAAGQVPSANGAELSGQAAIFPAESPEDANSVLRTADSVFSLSTDDVAEAIGSRGANADDIGVDRRSPDDFCRRLAAAFQESDQSQLDWWLPYYSRLYELAGQLKPKHVCEIGVRAGYSAFAILSASPGARMLGVEMDADERATSADGGKKRMWLHARRILAPFDFQLLIVDSQHVRRLPDADLIYIDGDHSYQGCLADLRLAAKSAHRILVDDFANFPNVRQACETFLSEQPAFRRRHIDGFMSGFLLLERPAPPP